VRESSCSITVESGLAIERAHYRLTYRPRAGGAEVVETGRHVECRRKIGGQWLIVTEIWNTDAPPTK
jgi:ketosteroid isomerase-like protein